MKQLFFFFTILYCIPLQAQEFDTKKMRYIERFKYWAMDEQIRTGVPAAISLAQGILETGSGTSELCTEANNHFGIKCKKEWTGETFLHDDDKRHECFRKYKSAKDSYLDHSNFLRDRAHYRFLFDLEPTDYQGWCKGLRKAGYATNPQYAIRLIQLIEKYNLQQYTYEAIELGKEDIVAEVVPEKDKEPVVEQKKREVVEVVKVQPKPMTTRSKPKHIYAKLTTKNGRSGFWARKGDYLLPEAVQYSIRYAKLLAINDLEDAPLYDDMFIYLRKKSKRGDRMFHRVKEGESIHSISQNTGVQLKYLYVYNNLYEGEEPAVGEKIYLQGQSTRTPRLRGQESPALVKKSKTDAISGIENKVRIAAKKKTIPQDAKVVFTEKKVPDARVVKKELTKERENKPVKVIEKKKQVIVKVPVKQKQVEKQIIDEPRIIKRVPKENIEVLVEKPITTKTTATRTPIKGILASSPILDLEKAKRVEELMGDGKREIESLYKPVYKEVVQEKVISEPGTNNVNLEKEKRIRTNQKIKSSKKKRKYDDENVSEDVKNLKKKFDSLIYEDE